MQQNRKEGRKFAMKNILIVDDNCYFLTGLSMSLCVYLKNCNILTAESGARALEILDTLPIELIVSDLYMPAIDGYKLVESVKKNHPDIPVFIMTGGLVRETEKRLASLGAARCIEKPFGFKELADLIMSEINVLSPVAA
jgi:DNA-binding NtrC family response regulator